MNTQNKNSQCKGLPKKDYRWRWMAGAAAGAAAGITSAQAGDVTVDLFNNYLSAAGGNHLNPDLTSDGTANVTFSDITLLDSASVIGGYTTTFTSSGNTYTSHINTYRDNFRAGVNIDGVGLLAKYDFKTHSNTSIYAFVGAFDSGTSSTTSDGPIARYAYVPITFTGDPDINDGETTSGSLEVEIFAEGADVTEVDLVSYTYDQIVLNPYQTLASVKSELSGLLSSSNSPKTKSYLEQAVAALTKSLAPANWVTTDITLVPSKGAIVFTDNSAAIAALTVLAKTGSSVAVIANTAIRSIVQADIQLAENAIEADAGHGNGLLSHAEKDVQLAETALAGGNFTTANTDALDAFNYAVAGIKSKP